MSGSGGWSTTQSGGTFHVAANGADGSNHIAFYDSGAGVGATAARGINAPATTEQFALSFEFSTGNMWGTTVGLGPTASSGLTPTTA